MNKKKKNVAAVTELSPYASKTVEIFFGAKKEGPLRIPYGILKSWPALHDEANKLSGHPNDTWSGCPSGKCLEKVDVRVGHVIIDFLHRGQCDIRVGASENESAVAFGTAVGSHKAANDFGLTKLAQMAFEKAYEPGDGLPLKTIIDITLSNYEEASASEKSLTSEETSTSDVASEYLTSRVRSMLERRDRSVEDLLNDIGPGKDPISMILKEVVRHVVLPSHGDDIDVTSESSEMSDFDTVGCSTGEQTATLSVRSLDGYCNFQQEHLQVGGAWKSCITCSDLVKRLAKNVEHTDVENQI